MNNQSNNSNNKLDKQLIQRFLDMANCADACYAMLHWIDYKKEDGDDPNENGDGKKIDYINPDNGLITTYARAIESRFNDGKVIDNKLKLDTDNIANLRQDTSPNQISQRTKDFVSRFELLKHKPDSKASGFSATLFKDTYNKEYIFAIRENQTINHLEVCNGYK